MQKGIIFLLPLLGAALLCRAQENRGFGLWTGVDVEKKLTRDWSVHLNGQLRFTENLASRKSAWVELGATYKLNRHFKFGGFVRYASQNSWNKYEYRAEPQQAIRYYADMDADFKFWKIKVNNRLRFQHRFKENEDSEWNDAQFLRYRLELAYPNVSRFKPFASVEPFYRLDAGMDQLRYRIGVDYDLNKRQTISVTGFTDRQYLKHTYSNYTLGLTYKLKL